MGFLNFPYKKILSKPTVLFSVPYRFRTVFLLMPVLDTKTPLKHGEPFLYETYSSVFFTKTNSPPPEPPPERTPEPNF